MTPRGLELGCLHPAVQFLKSRKPRSETPSPAVASPSLCGGVNVPHGPVRGHCRARNWGRLGTPHCMGPRLKSQQEEWGAGREGGERVLGITRSLFSFPAQLCSSPALRSSGQSLPPGPLKRSCFVAGPSWSRSPRSGHGQRRLLPASPQARHSVCVCVPPCPLRRTPSCGGRATLGTQFTLPAL